MAQITLNSSGVASNGSLLLQSNGTTTAVTIDASQKVGVGITPSAWLSTSKAMQVGYMSLVDRNTTEAYVGHNFFYNSSNSATYSSNGYASRMGLYNGTIFFDVAASGTAGNAVSFNQAMTLDASGKLSVGTTASTDARLYVRGAGTTSATASFEASNSAGATRFYVQDDGTTRFFGSAGAETARITSAGEFLVGTNSASGSGATSGKQVIQFAGATGNGLYVDDTRTSAGTDIAVVFGRGATAVGQISTTTTSTSYITSSDYRLKENIAPMISSLAKVALLKPCTYTWKSAPDEIGEGFIAHELAEVCPQAVTGEKDAVNEDGSIKPQGIDTSFLVATLTAAIQELKAIVDAQAVEIAALKGTA
jgi:hypothetical protein